MNASPFWPLVWKEYRAGRAFWLAMVTIALLIQGSVWWLEKASPARNRSLYVIALTVAAALMVGIGATMFAVEREEHTFGFVRRLPVRPWQLALPKILSALVGWGAFVLLLWLAAGAMAAWQFPSAIDARQLWTHWGVVCLECLAWGIFFSLLLSSPLKAAALTMLAVCVVNYLPIVASGKIYSGTLTPHVAAVPERLMLLALVAAIDAWLLPRWLTDRIPQLALGWRISVGRPWAKLRVNWSPFGTNWSRPLTHLMWQSWRELLGSWWALGLIILGILSVSPYLLRHADNSPVVRLWHEAATFLIIPLLPVAVYGSLVFHADQMRGPQFLAQRGVSARLVWLSRQIVWLGTLVALCFAIVVVGAFLTHPLRDALESESQLPPVWVGPLGVPNVALLLLSTYAVGQLASLFVRRSLLAGLAAVVLGEMMLLWARLMWGLGIAWWWTVLPIVAGCFAATWLRAPAWVLQRPGWRVWIAPALALALPTGFVLTGVPCFRAYQIPWVKPAEWIAPLPLKASDSPGVIAQGTAKRELYDKAWAVDQEHQEEQLPQLVELVMAASRIDEPPWVADWDDAREVASHIDVLAKQAIEFADAKTKEGELNAALDIYFGAMRAQIDAARLGGLQDPGIGRSSLPASLAFASLIEWSVAPGQTADRVHAAIDKLQHFRSTLPPFEVLAIPLFEEARRQVTEEFEKYEFLHWMPWEYGRLMRLIHLLTIEQLMDLIQIDSAIEGGASIGSFVARIDRYPIPTVGETIPLTARDIRLLRHRFTAMPDDADFPTRARIAALVRTTPLIDASGIVRKNPARIPATPIELAVKFETDYRATLIILALEAWKLRHGRLPAGLDYLLERELPAVPVDPVSGQPFGYFPKGMPPYPPQSIPFLCPAMGEYWAENATRGLWKGYLIPH